MLGVIEIESPNLSSILPLMPILRVLRLLFGSKGCGSSEIITCMYESIGVHKQGATPESCDVS